MTMQTAAQNARSPETSPLDGLRVLFLPKNSRLPYFKAFLSTARQEHDWAIDIVCPPISVDSWRRAVGPQTGFALIPDAIFYLRVQIDDLVTRVLQSGGFNYWEAGMDLHMGEDMYESFVRYQKWLLAEFDKMVEVYGFQPIDAAGSVEDVFNDLRDRVDAVVARNGD